MDEINDICNYIIEKLNNVNFDLNLEFCIDECCSRILFKNEEIIFGMDFFQYDFYYLAKSLNEKFDLEECSMNEQFLHSISSIIDENISLINDTIFMKNVLSVIDYNLQIKSNKKLFKQTNGLISKINYISEHFKDLCKETEEINKELEYYIKNS
ncbi:MAG: hypothetical protein NC181_04475 [Clostridium sp.]|nr:hypothetical protein [Clostridium sp.]MCM1444506.1 hypothetical protein [Candidatus Amulumruptor caecigallinarius]